MTFIKNFAKFLVKMSLNGIQFDLESKILFASLPKIGILDDLTDKLNFSNFSKFYPPDLFLNGSKIISENLNFDPKWT